VIQVPAGAGRVADLAGLPPHAGAHDVFLLLGTDGALTRWSPRDDPSGARMERLARVSIPQSTAEWGPPGVRLHVSRCGRFAAVVQDYGQYGAVVDLATGRTTMELDGGDYCRHTVPFSLAFAEHAGSPVVVHRTAWNRLDASDPATGRLLTARELPDPANGDEAHESPHYLDYFHGALSLSPDGAYLYDAGWVWHPLGCPSAWSLEAWLTSNPYESESGPTRVEYGLLDEWNGGACWLRADRIAIHDPGYGRDQAGEQARIQIAAPSAGHATGEMARVAAFPGPDGRYFADADGRVLLIVGDAGLEAWDVEAGERCCAVPGFRPTRRHAHTGELVEIVTAGDVVGEGYGGEPGGAGAADMSDVSVLRCWRPDAPPVASAL
jgi:hypothetical protein